MAERLENKYKRTKFYTKEYVDKFVTEYVPTSKKFLDISGTVYGELRVLKLHYSKPPNTYWFCECSCGNIISRSILQLNTTADNNRCTACSFKLQAEKCKLDVEERFNIISGIISNKLHLVESSGRSWKFYCEDCDTNFRECPSRMVNVEYKGTPCRCDNGVKFTQWTTELRNTQITQVCIERGLNFVGWVSGEGYATNKSRVIIKCNNSTHEQYEISVNNFLASSNYGCQQCYDEVRGIATSHGLDKFIENARIVHGDKFDYSEYKYIDARTPSKIICTHCNLPFAASYDNHVNKARGCPHEKGKTHRYTYLLSITENDVVVGIKIGKASNVLSRIKEHKDKNKHLQIDTIAVWEYDDTILCNMAETTVKRSFSGSYMDYLNFKSGSTETLSPLHIDDVIKMFEEYGGKRLTLGENLE